MSIINPLPDTFVNGTVADATQVNANFNQVVANVNANAAGNGANSDITSLSGLTTPLSVPQGGTGAATFTSGALLVGGGTGPITTGGVAAAWTPSDQSGAGLTFTGVSVNQTHVGNMVFVYGTLTYPATADGSNVLIGGLTVTIANHNYATIPGPCTPFGGGALQVKTVKNSTTFAFYNAASGAQLTNVALSGATLEFCFCYPVA